MRFDFEETFGDDYLYFYRQMLTDELSDGDTDDMYLRQPDVDQHSDGQGTVADRERQ